MKLPFTVEDVPSEYSIKPWGLEYISDMLILVDSKVVTKIKILTIAPEKRTSLQSHEHREEYMVVLQGEGHCVTKKRRCENNGKEEEYKVQKISEGDQIKIKQGQIHRFENTGDIPLIIQETQIGSKCDDEDIERYEDDYGRTEEDNYEFENLDDMIDEEEQQR